MYGINIFLFSFKQSYSKELQTNSISFFIFLLSFSQLLKNNNPFSKKWKENIINTYDYLLILNKISSRSYNDINQYPVIPWISLSDNKKRNFDNPISLQKDNIIEEYLQKFNEYNQNNNRVYHNSHYSTGA